jgi:hypothetical protein
MNRVAEQLSQLSNFAEGSEKDGLSALAGSFASAAETGDISAFKPATTEPAPVPPAPPPPPAPAAPVVAPIDTAFSIVDSLAPAGSSEGASAFQKLTDLKAASPAGFKQLMNRVAEQLSQLSNFAEGSEKDGLSALAGSFASAAETGDISAFKPASTEPAVVPPAPPPPPPAAPTVDPRDTAFSIVDSLTPFSAGASSDPLDKLSELKASSPASFKQVMNGVAERLSQLSNFAEGDERDGLSALASKFASAAESGDLSALKPAAASEPAPVEAPSTSNEQAPPQGAFERWRCGGHATASYLRQCQPAPRATDEAYASALTLFDSLTAPAAA